MLPAFSLECIKAELQLWRSFLDRLDPLSPLHSSFWFLSLNMKLSYPFSTLALFVPTIIAEIIEERTLPLVQSVSFHFSKAHRLKPPINSLGRFYSVVVACWNKQVTLQLERTLGSRRSYNDERTASAIIVTNAVFSNQIHRTNCEEYFLIPSSSPKLRRLKGLPMLHQTETE